MGRSISRRGPPLPPPLLSCYNHCPRACPAAADGRQVCKQPSPAQIQTYTHSHTHTHRTFSAALSAERGARCVTQMEDSCGGFVWSQSTGSHVAQPFVALPAQMFLRDCQRRRRLLLRCHNYRYSHNNGGRAGEGMKMTHQIEK